MTTGADGHKTAADIFILILSNSGAYCEGVKSYEDFDAMQKALWDEAASRGVTELVTDKLRKLLAMPPKATEKGI
jgi:hypothetical protein